MKNKTKYLVAILLMLISFLLIGATNVNAETKTVDVVDKDSLETAMNDKTTDIVRLTENITLRNDLDTIFSIEKSKTLDLNGHTITVPDGKEIKFWYYADADIKLINSSNSSSAKIIGNHTGASTYWLLNGAILNEGLKINFEIDGVDFEVDGSDFVTIVKGEHQGRNYESLVIKNSNVNGNQYLFWSGSAKKVYLESITLKGADRNLYRQLSNTSSLTVNDVIDANSVIEYYPSAGVKATADRSAKLNTSNLNAYWGPITVKFANGFNVSNATLNGKYGETPETNITIKNIGENNLQIKNVTVSDATQFEIIGNTQPTVSAGATNTDFKVKAKAGLDVGTYTATITVEAMDSKTYTATVTLKVEPKQLTGLGISGLDSTWFYGETKTPTATGVTGLGAGDYEITYSKKGDSENYVNIGNKLPTLVGKYKATLSITNPNYTASEASVDFEIKPITTEVKVKSYDAEFTYDGLEHTKNAYDVLWANNASPRTDNKLPNGDKVTAVITGKVRDVKDTALENNTIGKITITNKDNVDVTNCYSNIVKAAGKLTVNPITTPIVVTAGSDTKVYNGTELTKNTYTYTDGVLLSGDMLEVAITGSQKFVGSSNNTVSNVKVMRNGEDITSNYTMGTHVNGVLEVTSAEQPLAIADQYVKVNGSISKGYLEQSVTGNVGNIDFTIKSGTALTYDAINDEYVAGATAGDVVMTVTAAKMDLGGDNTPEWKETSKDFKVHVVNKTDVNITGLSNNETFTYDGNPKMPTGTISVNAGTVNVSDLEVKYQGTGTTSYNSATAPTNAGTYTVTYKVPDTNTNYTGTFSVAFTIKKAQLDKVTLVENTFEYTGDEIVSDGSNFYSTKMNLSGDIEATNVGNYSITVSLKDKANYEWKDGTTTDLVLNWSITQATPNYTVPTGLTSVKGKVLADVALPTGFTWNAPATVLTVGKIKYKATFTPDDTTNYKTITDIDIEVNVKNTFDVITSVPGGNGTITPSKIDVIEGSKVKITFTPNTGYMLDKVLVNGIEKTATGNEIEITVDEEKTVEVSYKKIPFTITVEEVTGATVNPDGTVTVGYGDNKDFTITANIGYKLVKVLVNDVEKALDGNTLKLKNITSNMKIKVVVEKIEYKVIEGAEQTYTIKEDTEARFRIDADYSLFNNKVYVDNVLVDSSNYTSKSGSTIITLKKEFVDTLSVGEHTLKVVFNDGGEAETTFTIEKKAENNNNNENNTPSKPEDKEEMKDNGSNPKTGDNIMLYVAIASMSIIGLVATTIVAKKKKMN
ncbi:MAG: hypothetical protein ACLUZU_15165 [Faecalibacillus intestinalis]|uniref:hypothetical protein n=1 Tax=Faecalibacillus intestinalis TaxID=1982626 RepID=UPI00399B6753